MNNEYWLSAQVWLPDPFALATVALVSHWGHSASRFLATLPSREDEPKKLVSLRSESQVEELRWSPGRSTSALKVL